MSATNPNLMNTIEDPKGHVSVKLQPNRYAKDSSKKYFGRTVRKTHSVGNILQLVAKKVPQYDTGTVYSVCDALEQTIIESLKKGNSVNCLNLGVFYLACKGTTDGTTETPDISVKFLQSKLTKDAISEIAVEKENYSEPVGTITKIVDVETASAEGTLSLNGTVQITGKKLMIGGEGSGIWLAPATGEEAVIDESGADWTPVTAKLSVNKPGTLLFPLPKMLTSGTYRIVLKTKTPLYHKQVRKELVKTVSDAVVVQ